MEYVIKIGVIGFISSKVIKQFGKKDIGDIILGVTCLYVGVQTMILVNTWLTNIGTKLEWIGKMGEYFTNIF